MSAPSASHPSTNFSSTFNDASSFPQLYVAAIRLFASAILLNSRSYAYDDAVLKSSTHTSLDSHELAFIAAISRSAAPANHLTWPLLERCRGAHLSDLVQKGRPLEATNQALQALFEKRRTF